MADGITEMGHSISQVAEMTGFEPTTLRYYERIRLIPEPERTAGGHRLYFSDDVERLRTIARAKTLGLSLEEVGDFLSRWERGACPPAREVLEQFIERKLDDTRHRIAELVEFHHALSGAFEGLADRAAPQRCGPGCGCEVEITQRRDRSTVGLVHPPQRAHGC